MQTVQNPFVAYLNRYTTASPDHTDGRQLAIKVWLGTGRVGSLSRPQAGQIAECWPLDACDHRRLSMVVQHLMARQCFVLLSNASTPLTHQLYADTCRIDVVQARRAINCHGSRRGPVAELIISPL